MILTKKQEEGLQIALDRYRNGEKYTCIAGFAGTGKAQPIDTIIPTPSGNRRLGEIQVGDYVFDKEGKPTLVRGVFPQGVIDCYKVTLQEGRFTYCNDEHIFNVITSNGTKKNMTVKELLKAGIKFKNGTNKFFIPSAAPVQYPEQNYDIAPYTIGAFLGDGSCKSSVLILSSNDEEIVKKIADLEGLCYKRGGKNHKYDWYYYHSMAPNVFNSRGFNTSAVNTKKFFANFLDELTGYAYEKRIPEIYKRGSIQQRYELLQGLMDTDGSIVDNKYLTMRFTSTSLQLINDIKEVVYSLGYSHLSVNIGARENKYTVEKCYNLCFSIPNEEKYKFFSLPRKKEIALKGKDRITRTRHDRLAISNIEKLSLPQEMVCIYVDNPEHLYLTNDYIVTHNTTLVRFIIEALEIPQDKIRYVSFTGRAAEVLRKKGNPNAITAHKLLYQAEQDSAGQYHFFPREELEKSPQIIVVDEVSMLPKDMWDLLCSHPVYILALGDPFQLPPVLASQENHILDHPHIFLDEIMRQATESDIIQVSMKIRNQEKIEPYQGKDIQIFKNEDLCDGMLTWADQVLTATNLQRRSINLSMKNGNNMPVEGDKVICLQNNWNLSSEQKNPIVNGTIGYLRNIKIENMRYRIYSQGTISVQVLRADIYTDDEDVYHNVLVDYKALTTGEKTLSPKQEYAIRHTKKNPSLPMEFNYGYGITVHRAQGGSWNKVLVLEENFPFDKVEHARWLYTAITRASEKATLILK